MEFSEDHMESVEDKGKIKDRCEQKTKQIDSEE